MFTRIRSLFVFDGVYEAVRWRWKKRSSALSPRIWNSFATAEAAQSAPCRDGIDRRLLDTGLEHSGNGQTQVRVDACESGGGARFTGPEDGSHRCPPHCRISAIRTAAGEF